MTTVAMVVEGHGEVAALPILLRRLNEWRNPDVYVNLPHPIRVRRDRFLNRNEEFRRILLLAAAKCGENGWILVLLDADDDCPAEIGRQILERARTCIPHRRVSVVVANKEFEAWFIAAAKSLHGRRGFKFDPDEEGVEAEQPQDAKGWMSMRMASGKYRETTDQPAFSARMDLEQAHENSRSFRKLCREWTNQLTPE